MEHAIDPAQLLRRTAWLKALAADLVRDPHQAEDLVQDTWLAFLTHPPREPGALASWLRSVARKLAYRRHRSASTRERHERRLALRNDTSLAPAAPEDLLERFELQRRLADLVAGLDEPYRSTVILRFFEDLAPPEIARRQAVAVTTVRWRLSRALETLRSRLDRDHRGGRSAWTSALAPLAGLCPRVTTIPAAGAAAAASPVCADVPAIVIGGAIMAKKLALGLFILLALIAGGELWWITREPAPAEPAGAVSRERDLGLRLARAEAETVRTRAERDALALENKRLLERLQGKAGAAAGADSPEAKVDDAAPGDAASGLHWTEYSGLLAKSLALLEKAQRKEPLEPEEQARLDLLRAELEKIHAQARAVSPHPFFERRIFEELVRALYKDTLRLNEEQVAKVRGLTESIFADLPEDPASLSSLERYRLHEEVVARLREGMEGMLDDAQLKDWGIVNGYTKDVFYYGGRFDIGASSGQQMFLNNWINNALSEKPTPELMDSLKPAVEEYFQEGGQLLDRLAPGQDDLKSLSPEARAQLDAEFLRLQERFHEKVSPYLSEDARRKLFEQPPLIIRFSKGQGLSVMGRQNGRF